MEGWDAGIGAQDGDRGLKALAALLACAACLSPAWAAPFTFLVYGDSRADSDCKGNAVHKQLVTRMVAIDHAFVVHTGDMIAGFGDTSNFVKRGACTLPESSGSFKEVIAPLANRLPRAGLTTTFFPVIGNHDDNWPEKWYPDKFGDGICEVFFMRGLIPNHTQMHYYRGARHTRIPDGEFQRLLCSKTEKKVFPDYAYYSFDYQDSHFVVMRVNHNKFNLESCTRCSDTKDYSDYSNIHQLDWLVDDLEAARRNRATKNIFVFLHSPVFGSGDHHPNTPSWKKLAAIFTEYRVEMVFSGHAHLYERTVPIVANAASPEGVRNAAGTVYVTTGGGGSGLHGFKPKPWYSEVRQSVYHYVEVRVDGDRLHMRAIDVDGKQIDEVKR